MYLYNNMYIWLQVCGLLMRHGRVLAPPPRRIISAVFNVGTRSWVIGPGAFRNLRLFKVPSVFHLPRSGSHTRAPRAHCCGESDDFSCQFARTVFPPAVVPRCSGGSS